MQHSRLRRIANPQGNRSSLFKRRIANPPERLAGSRFLLHLAELRFLFRLADLRFLFRLAELRFFFHLAELRFLFRLAGSRKCIKPKH